jgi:hypothetical protein
MIREALEFLRGKWVEGQTPIEVPSGRKDRKIFLRRNATQDTWEDFEVELPVPPLNGFANSLESFGIGLAQYAEMRSGDNGRVVVYVSETEVQAVISECGSRIDRLHLPLTRTSVWDVCESLTRGKRFNQAELLQLLRIDLYGLVDAALVGRFRVLDWQRADGMKATQNRVQESLGRSVEARVQGTEELPECITVPVQVWLELPAIVRPMPIFIDPEPLQNTFRVSVPIKAIDEAETTAVAELVLLLRETLNGDEGTTPVIAGQPEACEIAKATI